MELLRNFWIRLRTSELFLLLPEPLRDSPGLGVSVALAVVVAVVLFLWLVAGPGTARRRTLRREIRECRRHGDQLGAGRRWEALGKDRAALRAYERGGHPAEAVDLLTRRGRTARARAVARQAGEWELYAELCEADGELAEAAQAHERAGRAYAAAGCWERAGMPNEAAHCYLRAEMHTQAIELLMAEDGGASAETLEEALRQAMRHASGGPDARTVAAVRRCAQLWLEAGDAERAWRLALDSGEVDVAVPIARHHLPPRADTAEACLAAGAHLAAAEIYQRLGDRRREALARAEHNRQGEQAAEAARWFEIAEEWDLAAEQWAASGEPLRAAELFARSGDFETAARLFGDAGDPVRQQDMTARAAARADSRGSSGGAPELAAADRYRLGEEIGRGGMGVVYRGEDLLLKRDVACKVLLRDRLADPEEAEGLLAEARAAARLSHPNIVQVYDAGHDERGFFVVMELVEGETFAELLEQRRLSIRGAITVGRQVCAALAHAHERRILHRDLKPSNLIWTAGRRVKLTDFGLARAFDATADKIVTRPAGTPSYMAPEQIRGEGVDPRTDLYSFGCVLYELLTGRGPFAGGSSIHHHLDTPPDDPRALRPEIPEALAALVLRCLEKDPQRRPASAREVGRTLAELAR